MEKDSYGKGRLSIISEAILFIDKKLDSNKRAKDKEKNRTDSSIPAICTITGDIQALIKVKVFLESKKRNTIRHSKKK